MILVTLLVTLSGRSETSARMKNVHVESKKTKHEFEKIDHGSRNTDQGNKTGYKYSFFDIYV
jgi:hypothetical protein